MKTVYLVRPVRNCSKAINARIYQYKRKLRKQGYIIYDPAVDTPQETDDNGLLVCSQNYCAICTSDEVHVFWDESSQGSMFDLGIAWALHKPIVIINRSYVQHAALGKSMPFEKVLLKWEVLPRTN